MIYLPHVSYHLLNFKSCQSWLVLDHLGTTNSRTEAPLFVPEMLSPNILNRESRTMGFGRVRGVWATQVIIPQHLDMVNVLVEDCPTWMALLVEEDVKGLREWVTKAGLMVGKQVKFKNQVLKIIEMVIVMVVVEAFLVVCFPPLGQTLK